MLFKDLIHQFTPVPWHCVFEHTTSLKRFFVRIALVTTRYVNRESAVICHVLARKVIRMYRKSGPLSTSLYLKQCGVSLQRYYAASSRKELDQMAGASVALSRAGLPVIIPVHHRQLITARGERGDHLVRLYLSLFTVCRIIKLAKPIGRHTFSSIDTPIADMGAVKEVMQVVKESASRLLTLYLPWLRTIPLELGFKFVPTWKSTPNDDRMFSPEGSKKPEPTVFTSLKYEIAAFARDLRLIHSWEGVFSPGILFRWGYTLYPLDTRFNTRYANEALSFYEGRPGHVFDDLAQAFGQAKLHSGRLAQSLEGAGKRRLFVIGNYFKQRLLYPVHVWAMTVLRRIPTDGTYNQMRPIHRLIQSDLNCVSSFDLSSATDRWPVPVIHDLVACIFGQTLASCIVNGGLALNACSLESIIKKHKNICFVAGQPLGYYSSWALFALTHHFVVWLAADKVCPHRTRPFRQYALLGDDIVIADKDVAVEYRKYLDKLQVKVSDAKSLVSDRGAFEFAKQFWVRSKDLSPVSAKAVLSSYSTMGVISLSRKYGLPLVTTLKLGGAGYRVKARIDRPKYLSKRFARLVALHKQQQLSLSGLPLDWWLGRGYPLSPHLKGRLIAEVRDRLKLKQLVLVPEDRFWGDGELWTTENQMYRNWLSSWLHYLKWYVHCQTSNDVSIEDLFSPPVVSFTWKRVEDEVRRHRQSWSVLYRLYDYCDDKGPGWCPPCLTAHWPELPEKCLPQYPKS